MPKAAAENAAPSTANDSPQAEMMSLLRNISADMAKLHGEVTSLRKENKRMGTTLQNLSSEVEEIKESVSEGIVEDISKRLKKNMHSDIVMSMSSFAQEMENAVAEAVCGRMNDMESSVQDALGEFITSAVEEGLQNGVGDAISAAVGEGLEETVSDAVSTAISGKLQRSEMSLHKGFQRVISEQITVLRGDIAQAHHSLDGSSSIYHGVHGQGQFTLFRRLPPELRLKIWRTTCFDNPAVVKLSALTAESSEYLQGFKCPGYRVPAVLQTCQESRCEALKWYSQMSLQFKYNWGSRTVGINPKYFNLAADIFYLNIDEDLAESFGSPVELMNTLPVFSEFRRFAISLSAFNEIDWEDEVAFLLKPQCKVEEIIILINESEWSETITQQLVPAWVPFRRKCGTIVSHEYWSHHYFEDFMNLKKKIKDIEKDAAKFAETLTGDLGVYTQKPERPVFKIKIEPEADDSSILNSMPSIAGSSVGNKVRDTATNTRGDKLWPDFTIMTIKDVYPVINNGLTLG